MILKYNVWFPTNLVRPTATPRRYEIICGPLPFGQESEDRLDLFQQILEAPLKFPKIVTDKDAMDLLCGATTALVGEQKTGTISTKLAKNVS